MRRFLAVPLAVAVVAGVLSTGGCVSKEEHDKALAANRRAEDALQKALADMQALRKDNERLKDEIAARDAQIAALKQEIAVLEKTKAELEKALADLKDTLAKIKGAPSSLPPQIAIPELDSMLRELARQYPELFEYNAKNGMLKLKSDLLFEPGSDVVQEGAKQALAKFVEIMNSAKAAKYNVYVAGHTDDMLIKKPETKRKHPNNWYLSVHRAVSVEEVLQQAGLASTRMGAMGFSEFHPIAANASGNKGNKVNRRVELWIVPPDRFLTTSGTADEAPAPAAPTEPAPE